MSVVVLGKSSSRLKGTPTGNRDVIALARRGNDDVSSSSQFAAILSYSPRFGRTRGFDIAKNLFPVHRQGKVSPISRPLWESRPENEPGPVFLMPITHPPESCQLMHGNKTRSCKPPTFMHESLVTGGRRGVVFLFSHPVLLRVVP